MRTRISLEDEVAALARLSRSDLAVRWERIYGSAPTSGIRTELLVRSAAWHMQAKHLGGLSTETRRLLRSAIAKVETKLLDRSIQGHIADGGIVEDPDEAVKRNAAPAPTVIETATASALPTKRQRRQPSPGARLLRDWNGRTHVVEVIEGGFLFEAKVYPSLTAIAQMITGAHWSGPRFFGL